MLTKARPSVLVDTAAGFRNQKKRGWVLEVPPPLHRSPRFCCTPERPTRSLHTETARPAQREASLRVRHCMYTPEVYACVCVCVCVCVLTDSKPRRFMWCTTEPSQKYGSSIYRCDTSRGHARAHARTQTTACLSEIFRKQTNAILATRTVHLRYGGCRSVTHRAGSLPSTSSCAERAGRGMVRYPGIYMHAATSTAPFTTRLV